MKKIILTDEQAYWLWNLLSRCMDDYLYFENKRDRAMLNRIVEKLEIFGCNV